MASPMKKGGADLALVVPDGLFGGGKGGGKSPTRGMSEPDGDEMPEEESDGMGGAFDVAADEFLDDSLPPEDRKAALKRAIEACMGGEEY